MIVLDTGGLYAALDANEALHGRAVAALVGARPPRVISPFVLAELDYPIATRIGHQAQMALVDEVARGAYRLEPFSSEDLTLGRTRRWSSSRTGTGRGICFAPTNVTSGRCGGLTGGRSACFPSTSEPATRSAAGTAPHRLAREDAPVRSARRWLARGCVSRAEATARTRWFAPCSRGKPDGARRWSTRAERRRTP
jgi:hypothetical protein